MKKISFKKNYQYTQDVPSWDLCIDGKRFDKETYVFTQFMSERGHEVHGICFRGHVRTEKEYEFMTLTQAKESLIAELLKYEKEVLKLNLEDNNNNNSVGN